MKKIVAAVSLVYLVTVVAGFPTEVPESEKCVPNTTFTHDDGCNSCFCRESGLKKLAGCTRMSCAPLHARGSRKHRSVDEDFKFDHSASSSSSSYSKSHSVSWSSSHGGSSSSSFSHSSSSSHGGSAVASSSSRAVSGGGSQAGSSSKSVSVSTDTCLPGSSFLHSDNCNTCTCPDSGIRSQAACTEKACINVTPQGHTHHSSESSESSEHHTTPVSTDTCLPGSSFLHSDNCNTCTCPESGVKSQAACTLKLCPNVTPQGDTHHSSESSGPSVERLARDTSQTCEPGTSFMHSDNCNRCFCPPSGLKSQAGCTQTFCFNTTLPVTTAHNSSESSAESSEHVAAKRDTSQTCEPGTSFMDAENCNSCFCPPSGLKSQADCTMKLCYNTTLPVTTVHHSSESSAESSEHVAAKRDTSQTCEPGTSFMDAENCNSCLCPPSGLKSQAGCTEKLCINTTLPGHTHHSSESSESSEHRTTRDTSQTCEPGTSFMDAENCNSCLCPPSGLKSQAGCTMKLCYNTTLPVTTVHHSSESSADTSEHVAAKRETSGESSEETCAEGDKWIAADGCNHCWCPNSRKKSQAACTRMACLPPHLIPSKDY